MWHRSSSARADCTLDFGLRCSDRGHCGGYSCLSAPRPGGSDPVRPTRPTPPGGFQQALQPLITNLALSESVGIFGLVLAFLSGDPGYSVAFTAVALVLMYVHRPSAPDLTPPIGAGYLGNDPTPIN